MFLLIKTWLAKYQLIIAAMARVVAFSGGWTLRAWKAEADQLAAVQAAAEAKQAIQARYDAEAKQLEKALADQRAKNRNINERIKNALNNPVYSSCRADADGVRAINDAVRAANAAR